MKNDFNTSRIRNAWIILRDLIWDAVKATPFILLTYAIVVFCLYVYSHVSESRAPNLRKEAFFLLFLLVVFSVKKAFICGLLFVSMHRKFGFSYITAFVSGFIYEVLVPVVRHMFNNYTSTVMDSVTHNLPRAVFTGVVGILTVFLTTIILKRKMPHTYRVSRNSVAERKQSSNDGET